MKLILLGCGGAFGSILRYLVTVVAQNWTSAFTTKIFGHAIPLGTLTVNLVGCLLIGVLTGLFSRNVLPHDPYRLALTVGVLGGFTTFSAFGLDTVTLLQRGHTWLAFLYVTATCAGGFAAVWAGIRLAR